MIFVILVSTFIGYNILYLIQGKRRELYLPEVLAISYGLGIGFISLEMLLFYFLRVDFNAVKILTPWIPLVLINLFMYLRDGRTILMVARLPEGRKAGTLNIFLGLGLAAEITYAIFRALIKPIESYDAIAIYAIKSKIFYIAKSIPADFFQKIVNAFPHPDYPLNIPLAETFTYIFIGSLNDQLVKLIFPLYFIGILSMLYFAIRRFSSQTYALLFTFLLASIPQFNAYATNANLDLVLAYYCFISSLLLFIWFEDKSKVRILVISAVMAALAGWTKNEGLMYCSINIFLLLLFYGLNRKMIRRKELYYLLIYIGIIFFISLPWLWIKRSAHIVNTEIDLANITPLNLLKQSYKIGPILYEFQKQVFGPKKWNILWLVIFLVFILNYKKAFEGIKKYISLSILFAFSGYILFYMISNVEVSFFTSKTWSRFLLHLLPLVVYWSASILKKDIDL